MLKRNMSTILEVIRLLMSQKYVNIRNGKNLNNLQFSYVVAN